MAHYRDVEHESRKRREFARLVAAWEAAKRNHLWVSLALFGERLQWMGAYLDQDGEWVLYERDKERA